VPTTLVPFPILLICQFSQLGREITWPNTILSEYTLKLPDKKLLQEKTG